MIYELVIENEEDEVFAISLVENPAIERDFLYFNKEEVRFSSIDEEKRLVIGPILIPDKHIFRMDGDNVPYTVFFSKNTIQKLAENYLKKGYQGSATLEHDKKLKGVNLVESWIVESRTKDKSALYNMNLAIGTWCGVFKIDNDEIWNDYVKTGKVKGFSIEGLFEHKLVAASKEDYLQKPISDLTEEEAKELLEHIHSLLMPKVVELQSFTDYPQSISDNAQRGIDLNEKVGNKCAEQTGKVRAQQLANREPISLETIQRMYSFLSRAETYYDESDTEACGTISYLLWGGLEGKDWAEGKLEDLELLAEVGPRGGIRSSPKAPKSDTKNPNPKGEGTAKGDASGKRGAKVTAEQEKTLQGKVDDFNERDSNTKNGRAALGALKSVFQRGLGAFNTSRSPNVRSAEQWAYARVNAFLYLLKNGRPENAKYVTDNDLLPKDHPKYTEKLALIVCPNCGHSYDSQDGGDDMFVCHMCGFDNTETQLEGQPSFPASSYPGEAVSGSLSAATL